MIFSWHHQCFLCSNPIDLRPEPENCYEILAYYHYRFIYNPIPLFMNRMYLKYIGKRMRRVCTYCFFTYKPVPLKVLRDREIGRATIRASRIKPLSVTLEELQTWLKGMPKFFYITHM